MRSQKLSEFVAWWEEHITGDEKGEAQIFLDRLFKGFSQKGLKEAGATLEMRIKKRSHKGTAFADLVWKPIVLIEMKKRGTDLSRHFDQAFDYWVSLVPDRPRYVVLCNFDEFWVYDFEIQLDEPVDKVSVRELPKQYGALAFLFPIKSTPVFRNNQEQVTRQAADHLAFVFNSLVNRGVDREEAQRFTLQMLVALFAEDIDLLERYTLTRLLEKCSPPEESFDLIGGLFDAMNTPGKTSGGRFKGVDYFNGGLFAKPARVELTQTEINQLLEAARADWSKVRPEIFGTIFEQSLDKKERHAFGGHYTNAVDIMKIVRPTITRPWREAVESAKNFKRLADLHHRLLSFTVLDPACGSGNFLYVAYRELKRVEARIFERMRELSKGRRVEQAEFGFFTAHNFYGMDIKPFAVELAKVTMMIGRKLAIDELHTHEEALPLDNLDGNFTAVDALIRVEEHNPNLPILDSNGMATKTLWPQADVIIGNPPFLGAKKLKPERGSAYVNALRKTYAEVPGMSDYCVYWIRKSHDQLKQCTRDDPFAGRAGLVGTQNIRNNKSREGGLDHVVKTGTIIDAVDNQPWSGEANVHVSIVNWIKSQTP